MIAFLHNAVIRQHQDPVGIADTGKSVGDSQSSTPLRQFSQRFCHGELTLIVQCGSGLIQNDDGRIFQKYSGNTDPLFLSAGQLYTPFSHISIITVLQSHDEFMSPGTLCRIDHIFFRSPGTSISDIFIDRTGEKIHILLYDTDIAPQTL